MLNEFTNTLRLITCAAVLAAGAAIAQTQMTAPQDPQAPADISSYEKLKQEWSEAMASLKNYSADQRDAALEQSRETLATMDTYMEALEARTREEWGELSTSAREKRVAALRALRAQRNDLAEWYGAMKHSSASAWDEMKQGFIGAYGALSESFGEAWESFKQ